MTSKDNQQYVTVDMFNAKTNAMMANFNNRLEKFSSELKAEIRLNSSDIAHLQTSFYWGFAIVAIVIALVGFIIALAPAFLEFVKSRRTYATPEQVQEIVERAIAQALSRK